MSLARITRTVPWIKAFTPGNLISRISGLEFPRFQDSVEADTKIQQI